MVAFLRPPEGQGALVVANDTHTQMRPRLSPGPPWCVCQHPKVPAIHTYVVGLGPEPIRFRLRARDAAQAQAGGGLCRRSGC